MTIHTVTKRKKRARLTLSAEELAKVRLIAASQTAEYREVKRAKVFVRYHDGETVADITKAEHVSKPLVYRCIDKALAMGLDAGLADLPRGRKERIITDADKAWVRHVACTQPKDLGYAAELWSRQSLADHIRKEAVAQGCPGLARATKATVQRILSEPGLQPQKIRYYMERRDPDFEAKMKNVLMVYQEVSLALGQGEEVSNGEGRRVITVSVDEKPGVQAIANTAPDLPPVEGKHPTISRDHEYKRLGTASILAALDLQDGHVLARVERRHRSREFVALLKDLDAYYPADVVIRIILDNHSAHTSKETREYLGTRPNRFQYVHTPTHGSWLNLVETLFGKMARTFLKGIRVGSWAELKERILKGVAEINAAPVVHRWRKFDHLLQATAA
jgi:transposase